MKKKIAVIGAGPSGITALKNLLDAHLDAKAFDLHSDVGGNWIYSENPGHSSVFETTHIISSKTLSQFEDFPFDAFDPKVADYPAHDELRRYFQAYAKKFHLYPAISFQTEVLNCQWKDESIWELTLKRAGKEWRETFTHLVVCNGHHWLPRWPDYPGNFSGTYIHSHDYKKASPFTGKKVLVIGGGNSACDVAVETSRVSEKTTISWRRGYKIIPKFLFGIPSDLIGARFTWVPLPIRNFIFQKLQNLFTGSNKLYGLEEPTTRFGETHPVINDELLYKIRHGKVHPKGDLERMDGSRVYFKDGTWDSFDVIIACTGYILAHPFFDKNFLDYRNGPVPLYLKMFHPTISNLYFIGMVQPLGCIWPLAELQARLMVKELSGKWRRPKDLENRIQREIAKPHYRQIPTPRHTITVDFHKFRKELKNHLK